LIALQEIPVLEMLRELQIPYERFEHPPVFTVEEALQYDESHPGGHCKNLFLRDKKGENHYLVVLLSDTNVELAKLAKLINSGRLSFASRERLNTYLGIQPGAVGPFGLMNDTQRSVQVILDKAIISTTFAGFHPNTNTATLVIKVADLHKYFAHLNYSVKIVDFARESL
jgi:Ala-tRNA(Pro) deacylase